MIQPPGPMTLAGKDRFDSNFFFERSTKVLLLIKYVRHSGRLCSKNFTIVNGTARFFTIVEGTTEKVLQFKLPLNTIYIYKKLRFHSIKMYF
jgi:hypothetical protein